MADRPCCGRRVVVKSQREYVPAPGDAVWITLDPQAGHEQAGRRPAIVLSGETYNRRTGLAICCPITSQLKGYPFEVELPSGLPIHGAVLADQVKSLDWRARKATKIGVLPRDLVVRVLDKLQALFPLAG